MWPQVLPYMRWSCGLIFELQNKNSPKNRGVFVRLKFNVSSPVGRSCWLTAAGVSTCGVMQEKLQKMLDR